MKKKFASFIVWLALLLPSHLVLAEPNDAALEAEEQRILEKLATFKGNNAAKAAEPKAVATPEKRATSPAADPAADDGIKEVIFPNAQAEVVPPPVEKIATPKVVVPNEASYKKTINSQTKELQRVQTEKSQLQTKLNSSNAEINRLNAALNKKTDELLAAEAEVSNLNQQLTNLSNQIAELKGIAADPHSPIVRGPIVVAPTGGASNQQGRPGYSGSQPSTTVRTMRGPASASVPTVTVIVDKANLRMSKGKTSSTLMEIGKGTTLVVEKREGDWLRVLAPSGERAWIDIELVRFN